MFEIYAMGGIYIYFGSGMWGKPYSWRRGFLGESEGVEETMDFNISFDEKMLIDWHVFLFFLINVHAQIKKWIPKSDWSHKMIEWKLYWRPYQMLNVKLEKYFLCIPGCFGYLLPVFPVCLNAQNINQI